MGCESPTDIAKDALNEKSQAFKESWATQQLNKKLPLYEEAISQGHKTVACKYAIEMSYYASQTHNDQLIQDIKDKRASVCGK